MRTVLEVLFWLSIGLLVYAQLGYPLLLGLFSKPAPDAPPLTEDELFPVTLVIAAYAEAAVIEAKVANALALDYPRERLQIIVACDGSPDDTPALAKAAGADLVLDLPHGGKMAAQNAAVEQATGDILTFSDANTMWEPDALRKLIEAFHEPGTDYVCGRVNFVNETGDNQEGVYWRYEMWLRARESALKSVTAGNGAIYAVNPATYREISPVTGHDLTLPFNTVKLGGRAIYAPTARANETMVPSIDGEFKRKRRMMSFAWPIILRGGMLKPKGYGIAYGWMMFSHRVLRYKAPFIHLLALITSLVLAFDSTLYLVLLLLQVAFLLAAAAGGVIKFRPLLIARYYVLTTASVALGLFDYLRKGNALIDEGWEPPEGTR
jgi:cellulose synthase/poly-beta-1,6-N-acetylglucosamine synthase-like glycosyltransferase